MNETHISTVRIESLILTLRGKKVIMDSKLAELYGVTTKRLNEQVKRNIERFPDDFMFQIDAREYENMRSHFATGSGAKRNVRFMPYFFYRAWGIDGGQCDQ